MALKTLQKKYDQLLKVFEEVGVKLTESQKETLDTFMLDFQDKLNETRDNAIKVTKRLVEEKLEREFKKVVGSVIAHQRELCEQAARLDIIKSQKVMTEAVDSYLGDCVKEVLPKKVIVDYKRMQKLEQVQESLKSLLLVNDDDVERKVESVKEELERNSLDESRRLKDELDKCKKMLDESQKNLEESQRKLTESVRKCDNLAKSEIIDRKTRNLPITESRMVRKRLEKMPLADIESKFKTVLESVQDELQEQQDKVQEEKNLEEAIADLLEGNEAETPKKTGDGDDKGTESNPEVGSADKEPNAPVETSPEDDEAGVQVTESMMQSWIDTLARLTPKH